MNIWGKHTQTAQESSPEAPGGSLDDSLPDSESPSCLEVFSLVQILEGFFFFPIYKILLS